MKMKNLWMVPAITVAASTSAFSQAPAVNEIPAASKVNKNAAEFEAGNSEDILKKITEFVDEKAKEEGQEFDTKKVIEALGLDSVTSYAYSSEEQDDEFLNLMYLHDAGANKGIFKLFGKESKELNITKMSPSGTDMAIQLQLDLATLEELILSVMKAGNAPDDTVAEFKENMNELVPALDMTTSEILKKALIDVNLALDLDPNEKLQLPFPGVPAIDKPNLVLRAKKVKWAWPALEELLQEDDSPFARSEKGGVVIYKLNDQVKPMAEGFGYSPIIVMDTIIDQLWFASSEEFLKIAKSGKHTLAEDPHYIAASKGITNQGSSMSYVSKDFADFLVGIIEDNMPAELLEENAEMQEALKQLKAVKTGLLSIFTRDAEGLLISARSSESFEESMEQAFEQFNQALNAGF